MFLQRNKAPNEQAIPLLMPQHHMVIPHYLGNSLELEDENKSLDNSRGTTVQDTFSRGSSFRDIPLLLPQEADGQDAENEGPKLNGLEPIGNPLDQPSKISSGLPFSFRKVKVEPIGSDMPLKGFVDDLDHFDSHGKFSGDGKTHNRVKSSDLEWWETQDRGHHGGFTDESGQVGPCASCRCQVSCMKKILVFLQFQMWSSFFSFAFLIFTIVAKLMLLLDYLYSLFVYINLICIQNFQLACINII